MQFVNFMTDCCYKVVDDDGEVINWYSDVKYFQNDTDAINYLNRMEERYGQDYIHGCVKEVRSNLVIAVNGDYIAQ